MGSTTTSIRRRKLAAMLVGLTVVFPRLSFAGLPAVDAFNIGRYHTATEQLPEAVAAYSEAIRLNPQYVLAYAARGEALGALGEFEGALDDLSFALQLRPKFAEGYFSRGVVHLNAGHIDQAIADFTQSLTLRPGNATALYERSKAFRARGLDAQARADREAALRIDPSMDRREMAKLSHQAEAVVRDDHAGMFQNDAQAGSVAAARVAPSPVRSSSVSPLVARTLPISPGPRVAKNIPGQRSGETAEQCLQRAQDFAADGKSTQALIECTKAITLDSSLGEAYGERARLHLLSGRPEQAVEDYTQLLEIYPALKNGYQDRGDAHATQGDWESAIADYSAVIRLDGRDAMAFKSRAEAHARRGDFEQARRDRESAIQHDSDLGGWRPAWASAEFVTTDEVNGAPAAVVVEPPDSLQKSPISLADLYKPKGASPSTVDATTPLVNEPAPVNLPVAISRHHSGESSNYLLRGQGYAAAGQLDKAMRDYAIAANLAPQSTAAWQALSDAAMRQGQFDEAQRALSALIDLHPGDARLYRDRATIAQLTHNDRAAQDDLAIAIRLEGPVAATADQTPMPVVEEPVKDIAEPTALAAQAPAEPPVRFALAPAASSAPSDSTFDLPADSLDRSTNDSAVDPTPGTVAPAQSWEIAVTHNWDAFAAPNLDPSCDTVVLTMKASSPVVAAAVSSKNVETLPEATCKAPAVNAVASHSTSGDESQPSLSASPHEDGLLKTPMMPASEAPTLAVQPSEEEPGLKDAVRLGAIRGPQTAINTAPSNSIESSVTPANAFGTPQVDPALLAPPAPQSTNAAEEPAQIAAPETPPVAMSPASLPVALSQPTSLNPVIRVIDESAPAPVVRLVAPGPAVNTVALHFGEPNTSAGGASQASGTSNAPSNTLTASASSLDECNAAIDHEPGRAELYLARAQCHLKDGRHRAAAEDFAVAAKLDPANARFAVDQAMALAAAGEHQQALDVLNALIDAAPGCAAAYQARVGIHEALGHVEDAAADRAVAQRLSLALIPTP